MLTKRGAPSNWHATTTPAVFPDPSSCDFVSCLSFGCTDENACNYDEAVTYDDGSCAYSAFPYACDGTCLNDTDGDGTCDEFETLGCTDEDACNFSSGATQDDSSCTYDCGGCTNPSACNFDADALLDNGTCEFESCLTWAAPTARHATTTSKLPTTMALATSCLVWGVPTLTHATTTHLPPRTMGLVLWPSLGTIATGIAWRMPMATACVTPSKSTVVLTPLPATTTAMRRTTTVLAISALVQRQGAWRSPQAFLGTASTLRPCSSTPLGPWQG